MKDRTARDVKANYRAELEQRLGVRPALCEINAIGLTSDPRKPYKLEEGVAIIDISGVLTNDAWWWDETEYGDIQREASMAAEDPDVMAILLRVNSPGGETDNAFETARILADAGKKKPMWGVADNIAYSAGYLLLASAAEKVYVAQDTGGVGSIGVYSAHFDYSKMLEKAGIDVTLISAGKGKTDGNPYEPLSDAAKKKIRGEVDRLYGLFVGAVAKGRKMSEESIREMGAALFNGSDAAIASKLADRAGSFEDAWVDLVEFSQKKQQKSFSMSASSAAMTSAKEDLMADPNKPADANKPAEQPVQAAVDTNKLVADALAQGLTTAGEIADLCALAGKPEKVGGFIEEVRGGKKTVADVRKELVNTRAAEGEQGGEINGATLPHSGAAKDAKPAKSLKERMLERVKSERGAA